MILKQEKPRERHESQLLIQHAFELARTLGIHQLLAQTDEYHDIEMIAGLRSAERIIWGMKDYAAFTEVTLQVIWHEEKTGAADAFVRYSLATVLVDCRLDCRFGKSPAHCR